MKAYKIIYAAVAGGRDCAFFAIPKAGPSLKEKLMISNTQVVHGTGSFNTSGYSLKRANRDIAPASNVAVAVLDIAALENGRMHGAAPKCSRNNLECIVGPSTVLSSM